MSGQRYARLLAFMMAVLLAAYAYAEEALTASRGGPIVITSSTLTADRKTNTALFEGNVIARSEDMTLYADKMKVTYNPEGGLDRIEAEGSVRLVRGGRVLTADQADYLVIERKMTFIGNAKAVEDTNVVTGSTIVYLVDEERFIVEGGRVYIDTTRKPAEVQ